MSRVCAIILSKFGYCLYIKKSQVKLQLALISVVYVICVVQELGLRTAYSGNDAVYKYIRKIMALPFRPGPSLPRYPTYVRPPRGPGPNRTADESRQLRQATVDRKPGVHSEKLVRLQTADPDQQ